MTKQDRTSQLVMVTGFLALSYIFRAPFLAHTALVLGLIFLLSGMLSAFILRIWWKLAHILGWINSRILLSAVFFLLLLPISLISRLFTGDPLSLRWKKASPAFVRRDHLYTPSDLDNPW